MMIERIRLKNFKAFSEFDEALNKNFTLIVGKNGCGKSSLLDAVSIAFGGYLLGIPTAPSRTIKRTEVREVTKLIEGDVDVTPAYPVEVEAFATLEEDDEGPSRIKWKRSLRSIGGNTTTADTGPVRDIANRQYVRHLDGLETRLPFFSYYGTGRLWEEPKKKPKPSNPSRFDAYRNSHEARVSSAEMLSWLRRQTLGEIERGTRSEVLRTWSSAISNCFEGQCSVVYSVSRDRTEVKLHDSNTIVAYDNLSHGQRTIVSMVGDIAFKCVTLNRHLGKRALELTHGVVLIDEIDLHLHPTWQRKIIPALIDVFPRIQFIATTHSPFIIQSLEKGSVLNLDDLSYDDDLYNLDIETIAEEVQNVRTPERSQQYLDQVDKGTSISSLVTQLSQRSQFERAIGTDNIHQIIEHEIEDPALAALLKLQTMNKLGSSS